MALNPNISLAVRGIELQDPLAQYGKFAAIQGAQQQNQLAQMQMQKGQREQEDLNRLRMLDPSAPGYLNEVTRINPQLGSELGLRRQQQTTAERQATSADAEIRGKNLSYWQAKARDASRAPTDDALGELKREAITLGLADEAAAESTFQQMLAMPPQKRAEMLSQSGAPASEPNKPAPPPAKVAEYRFAQTPEGGGYRGTYQQFNEEQARAGRAPGATVNVSTGKKYGEAFATQIAEADMGKMATAEKAPQLAESANRIIDLVQQGNVFTGPAADIKLNIARALNVVGADNQEKIANTEALIAATGQSTLDAIKSAGLGTGQGFTDKDLKFLQGIAGGTIGLTPQTLTRLAELQHRTATRSVEAWGNRVKQIPSEALQGTGISTAPIKVPELRSRAANVVVTPDGQSHSFPTAEAAAKFKKAVGQ